VGGAPAPSAAASVAGGPGGASRAGSARPLTTGCSRASPLAGPPSACEKAAERHCKDARGRAAAAAGGGGGQRGGPQHIVESPATAAAWARGRAGAPAAEAREGVPHSFAAASAGAPGGRGGGLEDACYGARVEAQQRGRCLCHERGPHSVLRRLRLPAGPES